MNFNRLSCTLFFTNLKNLYKLKLVAKDSNKDSREDILQQEIEAEEVRLEKDEKIAKRTVLVAGLVLLVLLANLLFINYKLLNQNDVIEGFQVPPEVSSIDFTPTPQPKETVVPSPTTIVFRETSSSIKDHFISFGSGTSSDQNWVDVGGLQATVDLGSYGDIKEIRFETSIQVPGENQAVSARLYNKTDKHPVWNSEVTKNTGASGYIVSSPIIYDSGAKTYSVQMKTQLGSTVTLGEARLHIILK